MYKRLDRAHRALPAFLGVVSLAAVVTLLIWDGRPQLFPVGGHEFLGSFSLAIIALAYIVYQAVHRPSFKELIKAILLAVAFLFWSANQYWPTSALATLFNDIAIALFVFDMFLVMIGWPSSFPDGSFAENCSCGQVYDHDECREVCSSNPPPS